MLRKALQIITVLVVLVGLFASFGAASANVPPPPAGLTVSQQVTYYSVRLFDWTLTKTASPASLTLMPGETAFTTYTIVASATSTVIHTSVKAEIKVENGTAAPVSVTSIDVLKPVPSGAVQTCTLPVTLNPGQTLNCMVYVPVASDAPTSFQATVNFGDGSAQALAEVPVMFGTPIEAQKACADLNDGTLTQSFCADIASPTYTKTVTLTAQIGPYADCGDYTVSNTATLTAYLFGWPKPVSASADVAVHVPCGGGCSLTPGYWKTHSSFGPAPYDDTWALVGENTPFFNSGKTWYSALWTAPAGDAYYVLAHAYIAAKMNQLNGADVSAISAQLTQAEALLMTTATKTNKAQFTSVASILDQYNNGYIGPGHCTE